jgi:hypothetical protein
VVGYEAEQAQGIADVTIPALQQVQNGEAQA